VSNNETVELDLDFVTSTANALLLSDGDHEHWIARSKVTDLGGGRYEVPVWIAEQNGWV
jgi:hypothetical protein